MDPHFELFDLIGTLARQRFQAAEKYFARLGLGHTEARLMALLGEAGGSAAQDALSAGLHIDRSNAGRALGQLESMGYITRARHKTDKRTNIVSITPDGEALAVKLAEIRATIVAEFFTGLSEEDAKSAAAILKKAVQ